MKIAPFSARSRPNRTSAVTGLGWSMFLPGVLSLVGARARRRRLTGSRGGAFASTGGRFMFRRRKSPGCEAARSRSTRAEDED